LGRQEKQVVQEAMRQVQARRKRRREDRSLHGLVGLWLLVLVAFFLAPWPLGEKVWAAAHGICAQVEGHMLSFGGQPLPLCARDSGIYVGTWLGVIYLLLRGRWLAVGRPPRWFWWIFAAMGVFFVADVANSVAGEWFYGSIYPPHNALRLSSGLLLGMCISVVLLWALNLSFAGRQPKRSVMPGWMDMVGLFLLESAVGWGLWSGWPPLYLPATVLAMVGMLAMLLAGCFLWAIALARRQEPIQEAREVLPPLFWASLASIALLAVLSWLRYTVTG